MTTPTTRPILPTGSRAESNRCGRILKEKAAALGFKSLPGHSSLSLALRYLDGGRAAFFNWIQLAAMAEIEAAKKVWFVYEDLPKSLQSKASPEDLCAAAGVNPRDLLTAIAGLAFDLNVDMANLMAAVAHPHVVRQTIKSASRIGGNYAAIAYADRKNLLQHASFVPMPKGASINITNRLDAQATLSSSASVPKFLDDLEGAATPVREAEYATPAPPPALPAHTPPAPFLAVEDAGPDATPAPVLVPRTQAADVR
jgi:hypothetical protein